MSVPVVVQFPDSRTVHHLIVLLEQATIQWKDANMHNAALDALVKAEPTAYMVERLRKDFGAELEKLVAKIESPVPEA